MTIYKSILWYLYGERKRKRKREGEIMFYKKKKKGSTNWGAFQADCVPYVKPPAAGGLQRVAA